jgi:D-xylulose reductase
MGAKMTVPIPFFPVISKQLRILGSFRYGMGDYPLAISLVERGLIDLKPLVTHVVEFEEALEAFEHTRKGKDDNGKVSQRQPVRASCLLKGNGANE